MMGTRLAIKAWAYGWPRLGHTATDQAARVALTVMAFHALDRDPAPWYGQGWEPIAEGLGITSRTDNAAQVAVSRALGRLVDAGLIERTYTATDDAGAVLYRVNRRRPARWILHLDPAQ